MKDQHVTFYLGGGSWGRCPAIGQRVRITRIDGSRIFYEGVVTHIVKGSLQFVVLLQSEGNLNDCE